MSRRHLVAQLAIVASLACTTWSAHAQLPLFAAKSLQLQSARPVEADFAKPFDDALPARLEGAAAKELVQLANCRDYLAVRTRIVGSSSDADYRVLRLQAAPCVALALLGKAREAGRTALPVDFAASAATAVYPASLWPAVSNDERERLARPGETFRTASGKAAFRKGDGGALELAGRGMGVRLTLMARGDFDGDGWEDAAFLREAHALGGSYADARIVVLTRAGSERRFRELPLEALLAK